MDTAWVQIDVPIGFYGAVGGLSLFQHPHLIQHIAFAVDELINIGRVWGVDIGKAIVAVHLG